MFCLFGPRFKMNLHVCLLQITGYRKLFTSVEELRKEVYDSDKVQHEDMLLKVLQLFNVIIMNLRVLRDRLLYILER